MIFVVHRNIRGACLALVLLAQAQITLALETLHFVEAEVFATSNATRFALNSVAISPDGKHIYVAVEGDDAVYILAREPRSGAVTKIGSVKWGSLNVDGFIAVKTVAVSPDGRHVYTGSADYPEILIFERNQETGQLTYLSLYYEVGHTNDILFSTDGSYVYAGSGNSIYVFSRNAATGDLSLIDEESLAASGVLGLTFVQALAMSPDGEHFYATSLNDVWPTANVTVVTFDRDPASGTLSYLEGAMDEASGDNDGGLDLAIGPDGQFLYISNKNTEFNPNDEEINYFSRNATTGRLTWKGEFSTGNAIQVTSMIVDPTGERIYYLNPLESEFTSVAIDAVGGHPVGSYEVHTNNMGDVRGMGGAMALAQSPDGYHFYARSVGEKSLAVFAKWALQYKEKVTSVGRLDRAFGLDMSPDNFNLYVASYNDDSLTTVDVQPGGDMVIGESLIDGQMGVDGLDGAIDAAVSPDGLSVYATGHLAHAIAVFKRLGNGNLEFVETLKDGVNGVDGLAGAASIIVSPDNKHVYAVGDEDHAITAFSRDADTSALTFIDAYKQGVDGVDGLEMAISLAVSPDGLNVYVVGFAEGKVAIFERDATTGALSFIETFNPQGTSSAELFDGMAAVIVSPDGRHVYIGSQTRNALLRLERFVPEGPPGPGETIGTLRYLGALQDGVNGVDGLQMMRELSISPDGNWIFVAAQGENKLGVFARDPQSGRVHFVETHELGVNDVFGVNTPSGVVASPNNKWVFITSQLDDSVARFELVRFRPNQVFADGFEE